MPNISEMFAPAYQRDDPTKVAALQTWTDKNQSMTNPLVEETRMPTTVNVGDPRGMVDPVALRVLAQGGAYDMNARRNSIAAQVQANQQAAAAAPAARQGFGNPSGTNYASPGATYVGGGVYLPDFDTSQQYSPYANDPRFAAVQGYGGGGVGGSS